jgi:hypothetical protein
VLNAEKRCQSFPIKTAMQHALKCHHTAAFMCNVNQWSPASCLLPTGFRVHYFSTAGSEKKLVSRGKWNRFERIHTPCCNLQVSPKKTKRFIHAMLTTLCLVVENFRKFSQMETFRKVFGKFPTMFAYRFFLLIFYRVIYVSGYFTVLSVLFIV